MSRPQSRLPLALILAALVCSACGGRSRWPNFSTQQWPGPMTATVDPLPPGIESDYPPGPEEVIIRRLADPVQLKLAGQHAAFPLRYFDKRRRTNSGVWVFCSPGGRAEVLWPDNGTTVLMFDLTTGIVGSPSRGEPNFMFRELQRAVLMLNEGDQIELMGGALLTADSGPWLLERRSFEILRVKNQTKLSGELAYRNEVFVLNPGQTIDLPLLSAGGAPIAAVPGTTSRAGPGFDLNLFGEVSAEEIPGGFELTGLGEHEIQGLGIRLHLGPGERARIMGLAEPPLPQEQAPAPPPEATPVEPASAPESVSHSGTPPNH